VRGALPALFPESLLTTQQKSIHQSTVYQWRRDKKKQRGLIIFSPNF